MCALDLHVVALILSASRATTTFGVLTVTGKAKCAKHNKYIIQYAALVRLHPN